jgi:uncharacterized membrane protein
MELGATSGALLVAFLITLLELTEVVAIVYALGASSSSMRQGALGAICGVVFVSLVTLATGVAILHFASQAEVYLLLISAVLLWGFGIFLFRSTVKSYFKEATKKKASEEKASKSVVDELGSKALFSGGFSIGSVETLEAMIVLLALATGGYGTEAIVGFVAGCAVLLVLGYVLHDSIRKVKVPPLKLIGTTLLFTFAIFWSGEALQDSTSFSWPTLGTQVPDVVLAPIFVLTLIVVWLAVRFRVQQKVAKASASASS